MVESGVQQVLSRDPEIGNKGIDWFIAARHVTIGDTKAGVLLYKNIQRHFLDSVKDPGHEIQSQGPEPWTIGRGPGP